MLNICIVGILFATFDYAGSMLAIMKSKKFEEPELKDVLQKLYQTQFLISIGKGIAWTCYMLLGAFIYSYSN